MALLRQRKLVPSKHFEKDQRPALGFTSHYENSYWFVVELNLRILSTDSVRNVLRKSSLGQAISANATNILSNVLSKQI